MFKQDQAGDKVLIAKADNRVTSVLGGAHGWERRHLNCAYSNVEEKSFLFSQKYRANTQIHQLRFHTSTKERTVCAVVQVFVSVVRVVWTQFLFSQIDF